MLESILLRADLLCERLMFCNRSLSTAVQSIFQKKGTIFLYIILKARHIHTMTFYLQHRLRRWLRKKWDVAATMECPISSTPDSHLRVLHQQRGATAAVHTADRTTLWPSGSGPGQHRRYSWQYSLKSRGFGDTLSSFRGALLEGVSVNICFCQFTLFRPAEFISSLGSWRTRRRGRPSLMHIDHTQDVFQLRRDCYVLKRTMIRKDKFSTDVHDFWVTNMTHRRGIPKFCTKAGGSPV